jgi:hypothetical protein
MDSSIRHTLRQAICLGNSGCSARIPTSIRMNIYFSCSITGGRKDQSIYKVIVDHLLKLGHHVPTAALADPDVPALESTVEPRKVYERDMGWVKACDRLIAEVSTPSHGVGYEVAMALHMGKPVLCCYRRNFRVSKMLTGNSHPAIMVLPYTSETELLAGIDLFLSRNIA